ncbi:MAG: cupin domain-containing protein [Pseudomonadales bacterium]
MSRAVAHDPQAISRQLAEMAFHEIAPFNDGHAGVFWSEAGGPSPWEMHPECDELLQVLEGTIELEILPTDPTGPSTLTRIPAGSLVVVPRGCWHRQTLLEKTREFYLTPGPTLHSQADDPRLR